MAARFLKSFFSFGGRLSRRTFAGRAFALALVILILFVFLETLISRDATWILYPPLFVSGLSLTIRRLHDRASSAWWLLIVAIPLLGPIWLGITLFLRSGSAGENQYGLDPREDGRDYVMVDIHQPGPDPNA